MRKKLSGNAGKLFFHSMEKKVEEHCFEWVFCLKAVLNPLILWAVNYTFSNCLNDWEKRIPATGSWVLESSYEERPDNFLLHLKDPKTVPEISNFGDLKNLESRGCWTWEKREFWKYCIKIFCDYSSEFAWGFLYFQNKIQLNSY